MKNVLRNKKLVIAIIAVCFIGLGVAVCFLSGTKEESKKGNGDTSITEQTDNNQNKNENDSKENNKTDSSNENGLKVVEPQDGKVDSVDGSGSWKNNDTDTEEKDDDSSSNDTSDDNILVDDKVWGDVK